MYIGSYDSTGLNALTKIHSFLPEMARVSAPPGDYECNLDGRVWLLCQVNYGERSPSYDVSIYLKHQLEGKMSWHFSDWVDLRCNAQSSITMSSIEHFFSENSQG